MQFACVGFNMQSAVIALVRNREGIAGRTESDPEGIAEAQASYRLENPGSDGFAFRRTQMFPVDASLHPGQSLQIIFSKAVLGLKAAELSCEVLIPRTVLGCITLFIEQLPEARVCLELMVIFEGNS